MNSRLFFSLARCPCGSAARKNLITKIFVPVRYDLYLSRVPSRRSLCTKKSWGVFGLIRARSDLLFRQQFLMMINRGSRSAGHDVSLMYLRTKIDSAGKHACPLLQQNLWTKINLRVWSGDGHLSHRRCVGIVVTNESRNYTVRLFGHHW